MPKTISEAQADALSDGFLDTIGSDEEEFKPKKSLSKLIQIAAFILEEANDNLNSADRVSSGALASSMKIKDPVSFGNQIIMDIEMLEYWKFINDGVKGVKSGRPNSKYSFKNLYVGKNMLNKIHRWLKKEGVKAKTRTGGKPISKRERKRSKITDTSKSVAFAISKSVKAKGLKKTNFFTKAVAAGQKKAKEELGKSLALDIIETIPKKL